MTCTEQMCGGRICIGVRLRVRVRYFPQEQTLGFASLKDISNTECMRHDM